MMNDNHRQTLKNVTSLSVVNSNNLIEVKMHWEDLAVTTMTIDKRNNKSEVDLITTWNGTKV